MDSGHDSFVRNDHAVSIDVGDSHAATWAPMLADLADLARLAESQYQTLFVWMHPLRT